MLEQRGLLIGPWRWGQQDASQRSDTSSLHRVRQQMRDIVDLETGQLLGVVRKQTVKTWPIFRWLFRKTWQVLETEDESLLLTIHCPWGFIQPWEVYDAEDRLVCTISGKEIYDSSGYLRTWLKSTGKDCQSFFSKEKMDLGHMVRTLDGLELQFSGQVEEDPYAKMALLAAALTLELE